MIKEFLDRNNNLDAIILILFGIAIPILGIYSKRILKYTYRQTKTFIYFAIRRITLNYNLIEYEKILDKPENKRSKREKIVVKKWEAIAYDPEIIEAFKNIKETTNSININNIFK